MRFEVGDASVSRFPSHWIPGLLALSLVSAGCMQSIPGLNRDELTLEDLPGLGDVDLADARLTLDMENCRQTHLLMAADAPAVDQAASDAFDLARREGNATQLAVTLTRCQSVRVDNTSTFQDARLVEVSTPIETSSGGPVRHDEVLAVGSPSTELASHLGAAGLPVAPIQSVEQTNQRSYRIAEQATIDVDGLSYPFEASFTSVTIEAELPFGTATSIGRERWATPGNETVRVETGLNVTEIGGVSATLETRPHSQLAHLLGNTTRSAYGFQARYDARLGVMNASIGS